MNITISNTHPKGYAFAVNADGEQVFIPPHVIQQTPVSNGDFVDAVLVVNPNDQSRHGTPWMAVKISLSEQEERQEKSVEPKFTRENDREVLEYISENSYVTTSEIAEEFAIDPTMAANVAKSLFAKGLISKADVFNRVGQQRASFVLWASKADKFLGDA